MNELAEWDSFYLIIGGAAGALIGLQFVVMTLIAERPQLRHAEAGAAFATPTIIHFCAVLLLAAVIRAPWKSVASFAEVLGTIGAAGIVYVAMVARRMKSQETYEPVFEDWVFHSVLPLVAYFVLLASAFAVGTYERDALFVAGASALLLLFVGIHNAWDSTTYNVFEIAAKEDDAAKNDDPRQSSGPVEWDE